MDNHSVNKLLNAFKCQQGNKRFPRLTDCYHHRYAEKTANTADRFDSLECTKAHTAATSVLRLSSFFCVYRTLPPMVGRAGKPTEQSEKLAGFPLVSGLSTLYGLPPCLTASGQKANDTNGALL